MRRARGWSPASRARKVGGRGATGSFRKRVATGAFLRGGWQTSLWREGPPRQACMAVLWGHGFRKLHVAFECAGEPAGSGQSPDLPSAPSSLSLAALPRPPALHGGGPAIRGVRRGRLFVRRGGLWQDERREGFQVPGPAGSEPGGREGDPGWLDLPLLQLGGFGEVGPRGQCPWSPPPTQPAWGLRARFHEAEAL